MLAKSWMEEKEDPRITRTRNLILDAFMQGMHEKGFRALTVQDITARAGINRGTFYSHFADKYALLDFTVQQIFRQELEKRTFDLCIYSEGNLRELIVVVCEFVNNAHAHCLQPEQQYESLVEAQVKQQLQGMLQKWLEDMESEIDPKLGATAAGWAIYGLAKEWHNDKDRDKPSAEQFATQILPLIASNLAVIQMA